MDKNKRKRICLTSEKIQERRERYGIPDWRKEREYEYVKTLTASQLNWEFLRRRGWYRHMWEKYLIEGTCEKTMYGLGRVVGDELTPPYKRGTDVPKDISVFEGPANTPTQ